MKMTIAFVGLALTLLVLPLFGQNGKPDGEDLAADPSVRFVPLHITLDPQGEALAAYQFELKTLSGRVKIVGMEGGDHAAFSAPPYYDAEAMMRDRVIIAAFSTELKLPTTSTRIATLHLRVLGGAEPEFHLEIKVAADSQSRSIGVLIRHQLGETK